jgi:60 kDa SS-A/Ro ribonucleoprotein
MFYQSQEEVMRNATGVFEKALAECPEFAAKCAVYGHEVNSLKLVPVIWLVYLSTQEDKALFSRAFKRIITNVNLLHDFMEICRKTPIRKGLGRSVKRAVNNRLHELCSDYSVSRNRKTVSELVKVTRPAFKDEKFQNYMRYVSKDELTFPRIAELKRVLEKISGNEIDEDVLSAVKKYSFQLEELKHAVNGFSGASREKLKALSEELVNEKDMEKVGALQAGILALKQQEAKALDRKGRQALYGVLYEGLRYAALILNLVALERVFAVETRTVGKRRQRGFFNQEMVVSTDIPSEIEQMVCDKIRSAQDYRASNILPFALINAHRMVTTAAFKNALGDILNECAKEAFAIPHDMELLVGVDVSGSMTVNISDSLSALDIASFLGALIKMAHTSTKVCTVANSAKLVRFQSEQLFDMADEISEDAGGGTHLGELFNEYSGQKVILIITDSETADDFEKQWLKAKKPDGAKIIVWQLQAYQTHLSKDPSVIYLAGYSDRLLALVKAVIEDRCSQIEAIQAIDV